MNSTDRMIMRELAKFRRLEAATERRTRPPKPEKVLKPAPELNMERVLLLHQAGVSLRKIGKEFGCSGQHVLNQINRFGQLNP